MKRINTTQRSPGIQIAVLLLLLSSCTSGEQETGIGRPLEVTAEIAAPVTRATDAHESDYDKRTFVANDQINIYSGASASGSATVYKYSDSGSTSKWLPGTGDGITITTENETYTASFPTTFSGIKQNQTTPTAFWESNQLISSKAAVGNRVDFVFALRQPRLRLMWSMRALRPETALSWKEILCVLTAEPMRPSSFCR